MPWIDSIGKKGQLSIYTVSLRGNWATVFREALGEFNALSRRHRLGVTMTQSGDAPTDTGGADVRVEAADGQIAYAYGGVRKSESFDGRRLHGRTALLSRNGKIEKAFVFLPGQPQILTPRGRRAVGTNIMKLIAVHELVHACGLTDNEHSTDDLFNGNPNVDAGSTAARDRVEIRVGKRVIRMPPLILSGSTVQNIRSLWK